MIRIAAALLSPSSSESALIVVSEAAQSRPAEAPKRTPARGVAWPPTATATPAADHHPDEDRERGGLVVGVGLVGAAVEGRGEEGEPGRGEGDADPLPPGDVVPEEAVGDHGQHHQAAGDRRLDERDRRQREGPDVEAPAGHRDQHAHRVGARAEQHQRAPDRPAPVDVRAVDRAAVLVEEADDRRQRRGDGEQQADLDAQRHGRGRLQACGAPFAAYSCSSERDEEGRRYRWRSPPALTALRRHASRRPQGPPGRGRRAIVEVATPALPTGRSAAARERWHERARASRTTSSAASRGRNALEVETRVPEIGQLGVELEGESVAELRRRLAADPARRAGRAQTGRSSRATCRTTSPSTPSTRTRPPATSSSGT